MKSYLLLILLSFPLFSQTKLLSWNLADFGQSKTEATIAFIAATVKEYDIVSIQEVVAGQGGAQAVAALADVLNRSGSNWEYTISDKTSSSAYKTERYAFLWQTARVKKIGMAWLEKQYGTLIDREPYYCTFEKNGKQFTIASFHAITKSRQPETEIKYFKFLPQQYPKLNLLFAGDFNCPQSHTVFNPLKKMGYAPVLSKQKTSLKKQCRGNDCLANEFDNIFYNTKTIHIQHSGVIDFYRKFNSLAEARHISDHLPVWISFTVE